MDLDLKASDFNSKEDLIQKAKEIAAEAREKLSDLNIIKFSNFLGRNFNFMIYKSQISNTVFYFICHIFTPCKLCILLKDYYSDKILIVDRNGSSLRYYIKVIFNPIGANPEPSSWNSFRRGSHQAPINGIPDCETKKHRRRISDSYICYTEVRTYFLFHFDKNLTNHLLNCQILSNSARYLNLFPGSYTL